MKRAQVVLIGDRTVNGVDVSGSQSAHQWRRACWVAPPTAQEIANATRARFYRRQLRRELAADIAKMIGDEGRRIRRANDRRRGGAR